MTMSIRLHKTLISRALFATLCTLLFTSVSHAEIFVIKRADGSVTFTNKPLVGGEHAVLFVPKPIGYRSTKRIWDDAPRGMLKLNKKLYDELINTSSRAHSVDAALIKAIIHAESAFNPRAISRKGAQGLMQLMPPTAREVGVSDALEPKQNIRGGTIYIKRLLAKYRGNLSLAIAAYNAGPAAVDNFNGIPPFKETREYVKKVLALHKSYKSALS
jgi:hypothetical protein